MQSGGLPLPPSGSKPVTNQLRLSILRSAWGGTILGVQLALMSAGIGEAASTESVSFGYEQCAGP